MQAVTKDDARTQGENGRLEELLLRRKAEVTVLTEKRRRLEGQLEHQEREARALRLAGDRLQVGDGCRLHVLRGDYCAAVASDAAGSRCGLGHSTLGI